LSQNKQNKLLRKRTLANEEFTVFDPFYVWMMFLRKKVTLALNIYATEETARRKPTYKQPKAAFVAR